MTENRNDAHALWVALQAAGGIVTQAEIAARFGVSRAYASEITKRADFPDPVGKVGSRDVWLGADAEAWFTTPRKPGPAARKAAS